MATSNTYLFGSNTYVDDMFREAFERIGIIGNEQTPLQYQSALMSANLELASWPGRGLNYWVINRQMMSINIGQSIYPLPYNTVRILEVVACQPVRLNTGGTPFSNGGGNPNNCFDSNSTAGCVQTVPNGSIGYDYGINNSISVFYVGVLPLANSTYTLNVEYSFDGINWITAFEAPTQTYYATQTTWFVIESTVNAISWRIRETKGETLAIQQIYFSQPTAQGVGDRQLTALSRSEYMAIPNKMTGAYLSGYYFDQTLQPSLILWPVPSPNQVQGQTNLLFTNYRYVQDVNEMAQNIDIPQRFFEPFIAGLAYRLAVKFAPERAGALLQQYDVAYQRAAMTDYEDVTIRFAPDLTSYGG